MHSFAIKYVVDGETFLVLDVSMIDVDSPDKNNSHHGKCSCVLPIIGTF